MDDVFEIAAMYAQLDSGTGLSMRVYLDDERTTPPGWVRVFWPEEAIALLEREKWKKSAWITTSGTIAVARAMTSCCGWRRL
jgi:hypothetical protein